MAEGRLNQVDRTAPVQSVRGMGVAEPVTGYVLVDASTLSRLLHNTPDGRLIEMTFLPAAKNWCF